MMKDGPLYPDYSPHWEASNKLNAVVREMQKNGEPLPTGEKLNEMYCEIYKRIEEENLYDPE